MKFKRNTLERLAISLVVGVVGALALEVNVVLGLVVLFVGYWKVFE